MTKRFGFTLAEVLITLTIIGVIAAMTIPTLLSNTSDQEYKTGLKKAISTINQAITMQYALDGTNMSDFTKAKLNDDDAFKSGKLSPIYEVFQQRMQVISTTLKRGSKGYGNTADGGNAAIYLSDGMVIEFPADPKYDGTNCTLEGRNDKFVAASNPTGCLYSIIVDVNGDKGNCNTTNTLVGTRVRPKDCFALNVYADGVRPGDFISRSIMYEGK